jgi:hypothetical protein
VQVFIWGFCADVEEVLQERQDQEGMTKRAISRFLLKRQPQAN